MMFKSTRLLLDVAKSLEITIDASSVPDCCFVGVVPGEAAVGDFAGTCRGKQGMAWVRMMSMYPASGINVVNDLPNNCGSAIGMDFEVGMIRPVPTIDSRGKPPKPETYAAAAELMDEDAIVMLKAIKGCESFLDVENIVGQSQPLGPLGGLVGGTWGCAVLLD
jgi:hypothetical protein